MADSSEGLGKQVYPSAAPRSLWKSRDTTESSQLQDGHPLLKMTTSLDVQAWVATQRSSTPTLFAMGNQSPEREMGCQKSCIFNDDSELKTRSVSHSSLRSPLIARATQGLQEMLVSFILFFPLVPFLFPPFLPSYQIKVIYKHLVLIFLRFFPPNLVRFIDV